MARQLGLSRRLVGPLLLLLALAGSSASAAPFARQVGDADPLSQGWSQHPDDTPSAGVTFGAVASDSEFPDVSAWFVDDDSAAAESTWRYRVPGFSAADRSQGWTLRASLRVVAVSGDDPDASILLDVADGATRWAVEFGADLLETRVRLQDDLREATVESIAGTTKMYHLFELAYDPATGTADLYAEGDLLIAGYVGFAAAGADGVDFGSGGAATTGHGRYALVELLTGAQACRDGIDNDGDGFVDFAGGDPGCDGALDPHEEAALDSDFDGLADFAEKALGTDPLRPDSDADGLSDLDEVGAPTGGFGAEQTLASLLRFPTSVTTADLDGDGDGDVVSMAAFDIVWFENLLDEPPARFSGPRTITRQDSETVSISSVSTADLDGDSDPDVLSTADGKLAWYENRLSEPSADFGTQPVLATGVGAALHAADLDGDGDPDVLASIGGAAAWLENRLDEPPADFAPAQPLPAAQEASSLFAADLDGDLDLDVISASSSSDQITWHENRLDEPSADFAPPQIVAAALDFANGVVAADLDWDGDPDLLSSSNDGSAWHENRLDEPSADFGPPQVLLSGPARAIFAADLDQDGDPDALSAYGGEVAWHENRLDEPPADFAAAQVLAAGLFAAWRVVAAGLDGDGDPDVIWISVIDDIVAWQENRLDDPSSDFGVPQPLAGGAVDATSLRTPDLDGDGRPDVVAASDYAIAWFENRLDEPPADFGPQRVVSSIGEGASSVFLADFDGDGDDDLLAGATEVTWYENRLDEASDDFGPPLAVAPGEGSRSVFAADLDGDGDPDALAGLGQTAQVSWLENRLDEATADFGGPQPISAPLGSVRSLFASDLDGDGDNDVLSASRVGNPFFDERIAWYENRLDEPSADFGPEQLLAASGSEWPSSITATDLDGDGDPDVLSASVWNCKIAWYENRLDEPSADFGAQQVLSPPLCAMPADPGAEEFWAEVSTADVDGDGDPDVLSAFEEEREVAWYENRLNEPSADFGPRRPLASALVGFAAVAAADFDGDARDDVLSVPDGRIAWYENRLDGFAADPLDPDSDDDGLCDGGPPGTAPECAPGGEDSNGNGVYDVGLETDPNLADTDGDGFDDGVEVAAGTDPLDDQDFPVAAVPALSPGAALLLVALLVLGRIGRRARRYS